MSPWETPTDPSSPRTSATTAGRQLAVLIVDDDEGIRNSLSRILRKDGYRVDLAQSAAEAVDRGHWTDYFAILLDRRLPDNSADALLPEIRKRAPDAAVLIVTGYADLGTSLAAIRNGASDYLLKPVDPAELRVRLNRLAELKRATDRHREDAEQLRIRNHAIATALTPIVFTDLEGRLTYVNGAALDLWGYSSPDELLGKSNEVLASTTHDVREVMESLRSIGSWQGERLGRRKDGTVFPILLSASLVKDPSGQPLSMMASVHDLTAQKAAAQLLRQERDFAESLVETARAIVLVLDMQGRIVRFNRFLENLSGHRLADVRGEDWFNIFLPSVERDRVRDVFRKIAGGQQVRGQINPIVTRDGRERQIAWSAQTLKDPQGEVTGVLSIGHDVTTLQEVQAKLVQSERLAAIGQMIAGLAHESRNALQRAQACLEMLALDVAEHSEQLDLTNRIQSALDELQRLYDEVRGYAAPIRLCPVECDLRELWHTAWSHVLQTTDTESPALIEEYADVKTSCEVDRPRIEQVFRNILENAVYASGGGGAVTITCREEPGREPCLRITVGDEGPGLTPEQAEKIFEPFFTTKQKGTGLGMAIAKRIVEAHGGTIDVVFPPPTSGTEIAVTLPHAGRESNTQNPTVPCGSQS